jgi:REP element-mobilizing transposase RayT
VAPPLAGPRRTAPPSPLARCASRAPAPVSVPLRCRGRLAFWTPARAKRLWSGSYFAGSFGGAPITALHRYIEQQNPSVLTGA